MLISPPACDDVPAHSRSGSFELPFVSERLITKHKVDAVIAIGILLKSVPACMN